MNHGKINRHWGRSAGVMAWLVMFFCAPGRAAMAAPAAVTNLVELMELAGDAQSKVVHLRLEGTVWWSDGKRGRLILQDDSGVKQLELDLPGDLPKSGERIRLEGDGAVVKTKDALKLTNVPVVDNDGLHASEENPAAWNSRGGDIRFASLGLIAPINSR